MEKILFFFAFVVFIFAIFLTLRFSHATESFTFTALSYNIHGLPAWIAGDYPRIRIPFIAQKLWPHQIVFLQENFAYPKLVKKAPHPVIISGNASRFGIFAFLFRPLCGTCGSGLTTLLNIPNADILAIERRSFKRCSGWIRKDNDCWATKGFLWIRLRFANGAILSLYNLHLDSGNAVSDRDTRASQFKQIERHLNTYVKKDGIIMGGDFNASPIELANFVRVSKLSLCGSDGKRDYIFFRNGRHADLTCVKGEKLNFSPPLSDHKPILANFSISP